MRVTDSTRVFGKRSTAREVSEGINLAGRRAIVTGANTGIGLETCRALTERGCHVVMACRNTEKAKAARARLIDEAPAAVGAEAIAARLELATLDLAHLDSVRVFAKDHLAQGLPLHLLVNNAGVMLTKRRTTRDGFEAHFGVNHLGHFLLTRLLTDRLLESAPGRIVVLSSEAAQLADLDAEFTDLDWEARPFKGFRSYGSSKLMNILFSNELNQRYAGRGLTSNALHPGIVETELGRDQAGLMKLLGLVLWPFTKTAAQGAATSTWLATAPQFETEGGGYYADCKPGRVPALARDRAAAARLWELSDSLTGLA